MEATHFFYFKQVAFIRQDSKSTGPQGEAIISTARRCPVCPVGRGGLGQKFSPGIFCPDQPTTLSALEVGRDEREEPCMYFIKTI